MNTISKWLTALLTLVSAPVAAQMQTYVVQGTFDDGGSFAGTFEYDLTNNVYFNSSNSGIDSKGTFSVTIQGGNVTQDLAPFVPGFLNEAFGNFAYPRSDPCSACAVGDENSTPTQLFLFRGVENDRATDLMLNWTNALNSSNGAVSQPITGFETNQFSQCQPCVLSTRQVVSGFVAPIVTAEMVAELAAYKSGYEYWGKMPGELLIQAQARNATIAALDAEIAASKAAK
jgi:hypothetical protein